jgi:UDP:flavonoid glycosyltransferase YjiC (YdhE family)
MKICTFPNCAYLSETSRMITIYKELESRGILVIMATHGGPYEWLFKEEGIEYKLIDPYFTNERAHDFVATNTGEKGIGEFYTVEELSEHVSNEIGFFKRENITKVITGFTLSCAISARASNIQYFVTHLGSFVPPVFERNMLIPTIVTDLKLFNLIPKSWMVTLINNLMYKSGIATKSFNKVAWNFNIKSFKSMEEIMMGDTVIVTDVPEILTISRTDLESWKPEGRNRKYYSYDSSLKYGGAIFAKLFGEVSKEVNIFLQTDLPKIYIALTSGKSEVLDRVYEAVKDLDVKTIICTTLHKFKIKSQDNILVTDHLPSHKVMPMMDIAIIHGGQGSVQTAINSGIPIIGIPLHVEQGLNVAMIVRHGAGLLQTKHSINPLDIKEKITTILNDPTYSENMKQLSRYQKQVDGVSRVVDILMEE